MWEFTSWHNGQGLTLRHCEQVPTQMFSLISLRRSRDNRAAWVTRLQLARDRTVWRSVTPGPSRPSPLNWYCWGLQFLRWAAVNMWTTTVGQARRNGFLVTQVNTPFSVFSSSHSFQGSSPMQSLAVTPAVTYQLPSTRVLSTQLDPYIGILNKAAQQTEQQWLIALENAY